MSGGVAVHDSEYCRLVLSVGYVSAGQVDVGERPIELVRHRARRPTVRRAGRVSCPAIDSSRNRSRFGGQESLCQVEELARELHAMASRIQFWPKPHSGEFCKLVAVVARIRSSRGPGIDALVPESAAARDASWRRTRSTAFRFNR